MDEKLINGYINNLAQKVQELQMENILLLKTRIGILEQEEVKEQPKKEQPKKEG